MKRAPTGNSNTLTSSPSLQPLGGLHYMTQARSSVMRCYSGSNHPPRPLSICKAVWTMLPALSSAGLLFACLAPGMLMTLHGVTRKSRELNVPMCCECQQLCRRASHFFNTPAEEAAEGGDWVSPHQWWVEGIIPEWPRISLIMKKSTVQTQKTSRVLSH